MAGLDAAKRRGRKSGRPRVLNEEKMEAILEDLKWVQEKRRFAETLGNKLF